ncbi:PREDICTED: RPM1-interacting protein 4-like [Nelumbo nucifera]|uniref:RPM1-interacting protein 4-like n=1 Tax=Nelumbo nucifera TaxID=4432 RepID=A0A1U8B3Y7_NELNU|nr:PREDICTED: RPM1-interacting protein 4-like [Nelumbo nucifera]
MAQRSNVPKFGNWESEGNVPYTAYFDKARKGRSTGKIINPNDPQENPDLFSDTPPVRADLPSRTGAELEGPGDEKPKHEHRSSKEDADARKVTESPEHETEGRRAADLPHQRAGDRGVSSGETPKKVSRPVGGSDRSVEQSPLHPHYQAKAANKTGVSSPSWEKKSDHGHGLAPATPGRSRLRPRGDETFERGPAVPKFGDWDENNPASADGYTHIFNKVREEKQSGAAKVPVISTESSYSNGRLKQDKDSSVSCCCFGGRK